MPYLDAVGVWVQAHSYVVLPAGRSDTLKAAILGTAMAMFTEWHMGDKA